MESEGKTTRQKSGKYKDPVISRNKEAMVNQEERGTHKGLDHGERRRPWKSFSFIPKGMGSHEVVILIGVI